MLLLPVEPPACGFCCCLLSHLVLLLQAYTMLPVVLIIAFAMYVEIG